MKRKMHKTWYKGGECITENIWLLVRCWFDFLLTAIWVLDYLHKESTWIDYQVSKKSFDREGVFFHHGAFFFFFFFPKTWSSPIVFLKVEEINLILCSLADRLGKEFIWLPRRWWALLLLIRNRKTLWSNLHNRRCHWLWH